MTDAAAPETDGGGISVEGLAAFANAVSTLGTPRFGAALLRALGSAAVVDHLTVLAWRADEGLRQVEVASAVDIATARSLTRDYVARHHVEDPNFAELTRRTWSRRMLVRRHDATRLKTRSYEARFYGTVGIVDKLSFIWRAGDDSYYLNLYRTRNSGRYGERELRALSSLAPLVAGLVRQHDGRWRIEAALTPDGDPGLIERLVGLLDERLTGRERAVVMRILTGMRTEGIAIDLGIKPASVITLRKRAYGKLGIATQAELFALCLRMLPRLSERERSAG